mmetsp:Transcript_80174/g.259757  ORF Transcript_80174/g.259757 Transcript_80174/m.259757 type:complete len:147 (+) Transcript_80174:60-500(+)
MTKVLLATAAFAVHAAAFVAPPPAGQLNADVALRGSVALGAAEQAPLVVESSSSAPLALGLGAGLVLAAAAGAGRGRHARGARRSATACRARVGDDTAVAKNVKVGDAIPGVSLDKGFPPEKFNLQEFCKGKKVVLVGLPGAFTPT